MSESILTSTKKILGVHENNSDFDLDIMTHINSVFTTLHDLGVGPEEGFMIEDDTAVWGDFFDNNLMNSIKTYVYLKVRIYFDPPTTSYHIEAINKQVEELEWRLNHRRELKDWFDPDPEETTEGV